jgi:integrase
MSVKIREKQKANGDISLYLDIYHKGQRQYEFLDLYLTKDRAKNKEVKRLAEDIAAKRQLELSANNYQIQPQFKTNLNFVDYFEQLVEGRHRSWKTVLLQLKAFTGGGISFKSVDENWLMNFQQYLLDKVSPNTAQTYFNKIKAALNIAKRSKIILVNPADNIPNIKGEVTERGYLTLEEIKILDKTPSDRIEVKRAFLFACFTGLRLSDIKRLKWTNIQDQEIVMRIQKTSEPEHLPMTKSALKYLGERGSDDEFIFKMVKSEDAIWTALQRWKVKAGIKKHISFHISRHSFATVGLTSGIDLYTMSKLLGHKDIKTTQIYAKIIDQKKKDAVDLIPEI